jgi:hypothetical protein
VREITRLLRLDGSHRGGREHASAERQAGPGGRSVSGIAVGPIASTARRP